MPERDVWVYADPHFGHDNIITYCQRPFPSAHKMDGELVSLFNSVVKKGDLTYFLGDVTLKSPDRANWLRRIIMKMNGTKVLVFGNHDRWHWETYLEVGFQSCHTFLEVPWKTTFIMEPLDGPVRVSESTKMVRLCHDPAWAQDKKYLWVCGHLHNNAFVAPSHIAVVSVELTGYKPVLLHDIVDGYRPDSGTLPSRPNRTLNDSTEGGAE